MKTQTKTGLFLLIILALSLAKLSWAAKTEDIKRGVVKIVSEALQKKRIGAGIIVQLEPKAAYIVTAAHVVEGDPQPRIAFFTEPNKFFRSRVIGLEGGDPKGLAALLVEGQLPSSLRALSIDETTRLYGGEPVTFVGFPGAAGSQWTITKGTISGRQGRDYTFSGIAEEGSSGGPLLIRNKVVGIITMYQSIEKFGYATPGGTVAFALKGWGVKALLSNMYADPKGRFSIELPMGFVLKEPKLHDLVYQFTETGFPVIIIQFFPGPTKVDSLFSRGLDIIRVDIPKNFKRFETIKDLTVYDFPAKWGIYKGIYKGEPKVSLYGFVGAISFPKNGLVYICFLNQDYLQAWKGTIEKTFRSVRTLQ